jgi:hypothetical protein
VRTGLGMTSKDLNFLLRTNIYVRNIISTTFSEEGMNMRQKLVTNIFNNHYKESYTNSKVSLKSGILTKPKLIFFVSSNFHFNKSFLINNFTYSFMIKDP